MPFPRAVGCTAILAINAKQEFLGARIALAIWPDSMTMCIVPMPATSEGPPYSISSLGSPRDSDTAELVA